MTALKIRKAIESDVPQLLPLMRELAEFEDYADAFAIYRGPFYANRGSGNRRQTFIVWLRKKAEFLTGLLVYYFVAFTYRAKPNIIVKELYVADGHRSKSVGKLLMKAVAQEAERAGCGMIKWWVAKWNERGIEFYERLGAKIDPDWHEFQMSEEAFRRLAES